MGKSIHNKNIQEYKNLYSDDHAARSYEVRVKVDVLKKIIKNLADGTNVLEIGYGTGDLLHLLASIYKSTHFTGLEVVDEAKKLYKKRYPNDKNVNLITSNAEKKIDIKKNSFDLIIASHLLEHIENEAFLLREINRLLKTNGKLILAVPDWGDFDNHLHFRQYDKKVLTKLGKTYNWKVELVLGDGFYINKLYYLLLRYIVLIFSRNKNTNNITVSCGKTSYFSMIRSLYYFLFVNSFLKINVLDTWLFAHIDKKPMQWIAVYKK